MTIQMEAIYLCRNGYSGRTDVEYGQVDGSWYWRMSGKGVNKLGRQWRKCEPHGGPDLSNCERVL